MLTWLMDKTSSNKQKYPLRLRVTDTKMSCNTSVILLVELRGKRFSNIRSHSLLKTHHPHSSSLKKKNKKHTHGFLSWHEWNWNFNQAAGQHQSPFPLQKLNLRPGSSQKVHVMFPLWHWDNKRRPDAQCEIFRPLLGLLLLLCPSPSPSCYSTDNTESYFIYCLSVLWMDQLPTAWTKRECTQKLNQNTLGIKVKLSL